MFVVVCFCRSIGLYKPFVRKPWLTVYFLFSCGFYLYRYYCLAVGELCRVAEPQIGLIASSYPRLLRIIVLALDRRPPAHALEYGGANGPYSKFRITSLVNDLCAPRPCRNTNLPNIVLFVRPWPHSLVFRIKSWLRREQSHCWLGYRWLRRLVRKSKQKPCAPTGAQKQNKNNQNKKQTTTNNINIFVLFVFLSQPAVPMRLGSRAPQGHLSTTSVAFHAIRF